MLKKVLPIVALGLLGSFSMSAQENTNKINAALQQKMKNTSVAKEFRCIVSFESSEAAHAGRLALQQLGGTFIGPKFTEIPIQGVLATASELEKMTDIVGLTQIKEDQKLESDMHQAVIVSGVKDVWEDAEFTALNGGLSITGHGIGVLVNDSGFDAEGSDLEAFDSLGMTGNRARRVIQSIKGTGSGDPAQPAANGVGWDEDFANGEGETGKRFSDEGGGHGTHCLGIVGGDGRRSKGKYKGVAPGAYLLGYGSGAGLSILDTYGGFEYVLKHGRDYNIRVMSNSFGSTSDSTFTNLDLTDPMNLITKMLADKGVQVVFSAGNSGPANGTITGNWKTAPWVVAIGNGLKGGGLASSSSRGRTNAAGTASQNSVITVGGVNYFWENRPTVTAPGTDIVSVRATEGGSATGLTSDLTLTASELPFYTVLTGTSMACPHVAGIVALMMEANPSLEWRAIKATLQRTAVPMTTSRWQSGYGYVNAWAAVAAAYHGLCDVPVGATHNEKYGLPNNGTFNFAGEAWQTCTLHPEVASRIRTTLPAAGATTECTTNVLADDETGSPDVAGADNADIKQLTYIGETDTTFTFTLEVAGGLVNAPPSVAGNGEQYYDVFFNLQKIKADTDTAQAPALNYVAQAYRDATVGYIFEVTAESGQVDRPASNAAYLKRLGATLTAGTEINGCKWDNATNKITWRIPKRLLTAKTVPATAGGANTAAPSDGLGTNSTPKPRAGDVLRNWKVRTYVVPPGINNGGAAAYDTANGACFKTLLQGTAN